MKAAIPYPTKSRLQPRARHLALLKKARKDTLIFFLISGGGSAMFDLPIDPQITLEETIAFHQLLLASGAPSTRSTRCASTFPPSRAGAWPWPLPKRQKVSLLVPDVPLRTLDALSSGPTSPDHSTVAEVRELHRPLRSHSKFRASVRAFFEREDLPESPGNKSLASALSSTRKPRTAPARNVTSAAAMTDEDEAFRDSVFEILLSSHDLVENARALAQRAGYFVAVDNSCDDWDYADAARYLLERFHALRAVHRGCV